MIMGRVGTRPEETRRCRVRACAALSFLFLSFWLGPSLSMLNSSLLAVPFQFRYFLLWSLFYSGHLEGLLDVDSLLGRCLEVRDVALGLAPEEGRGKGV